MAPQQPPDLYQAQLLARIARLEGSMTDLKASNARLLHEVLRLSRQVGELKGRIDSLPASRP